MKKALRAAFLFVLIGLLGLSVVAVLAQPVPIGTIPPNTNISLTPFPTATARPATTATVTGVTGLAVRTGPYLGASMVGIARRGREYAVLAQNRHEGEYTWYLIQSDVFTGWASGRHLQLSGDLNLPTRGSIFDEIDNARDFTVRGRLLDTLNLRPRPTERMARTALIPWGTEVTVLGYTMSGNVIQWLHIRSGDLVGWVTAPFVDVFTEIRIQDLPRR